MLDKISFYNISIYHFLILSFFVFTIGIVGIFLKKKSIISILISIEVMLFSVNLNFVAFGNYMQQIEGQIASIFILSIAAAEMAVGLAILIMYFSHKKSSNINDLTQLKEEDNNEY